MSKVLQYVPSIKNGFPPPRAKTEYDSKSYNGSLSSLAETIQHGEYIELPHGSASKFSKMVRKRGLAIVRRESEAARDTLYVVSREWLDAHPEG